MVQHGDNISELIQVCWELNAQNMEREVGGLRAAAEVTHCQKCKIITFNQTDTLSYGDITIEVVPVWMC